MDSTADGRVEVVFGVRVTDDYFEARTGIAEFCRGQLVGLQIGSHPHWLDHRGLTIGVTVLGRDAAVGLNPARYVAGLAHDRVYVRGELACTTAPRPVFVRPDDC